MSKQRQCITKAFVFVLNHWPLCTKAQFWYVVQIAIILITSQFNNIEFIYGFQQAAVTTTTVPAADNGAKRDGSNQPTIVRTSMGQHVQQTASSPSISSPTSAPILQQVLSNQSGGDHVVMISQNRPNIIQMNPTAPSTPSSLIKSLLANKVNADGSSIGPSTTTTTVSTNIASPSNSLTVATNVNVQVTIFI